jgi:mannosyl-3-phosphoglycerate phosphatase
VVFVSAKTRSEIEAIRRELINDCPFVSENGGGLYLPVADFDQPEGFVKSGDCWCLCSSKQIDDIRKGLERAAKAANVEVKGFNQMSLKEISDLTGLDTRQAELAKVREFDEPFIIVEETEEKLHVLRNEIEKAGYRYNSGGYLHHITGDFDKGETVSVLINIYRQINPSVKFIGLGDAYNDMPMLKLVDHPFLVRRPDSSINIRAIFNGLTITDGIGPAGFVEAVESVLKRFC